MKIRLGSVNEIKAPRRVIAGIYGPPKAGKTHNAIELCPGKVIVPILNDANSLQTALKVAQMYRDEGLDREVVFMMDDNGAPIQVHIDTSTSIMSNPETCRTYYSKQYLEVLLPLTEFASKHADGIVTDNASDMMNVIQWAKWGLEKVPLYDKGMRGQLLMNYFNLFRSAGVHSVSVLKEQDVWLAEKVDGKTKLSIVGSKPAMYEDAGYLFTDIFQLSHPREWEVAELRARIDPAIKIFNHRNKAKGVQFRPIVPGVIVLSLVESQSNNMFNATNTAWLIDSKGDRKPDGEFYPDAVTLENVWGTIYPGESLDYWYEPVRERK